MKWVWVWLIGPIVVFLVLALAVHAGQHGASRWPYFLPLLIAGVLSGIFSALLALNVVRHQRKSEVV